MTIRELMAVCESFEAFMYDVNTKTTITLDTSDKDVRNLKVKDIYADCGVRVEVKFDKLYFHRIKKLESLRG